VRGSATKGRPGGPGGTVRGTAAARIPRTGSVCRAGRGVFRAGTGLRTADSEEALRPLRVGDEQVLGLLVVVEHHAVVLAAEAGLLVAAERRVRRVLVVGVGPHAPGRDLPPG